MFTSLRNGFQVYYYVCNLCMLFGIVAPINSSRSSNNKMHPNNENVGNHLWIIRWHCKWLPAFWALHCIANSFSVFTAPQIFSDLMDRSFGVINVAYCICFSFSLLHSNTDYLPLMDVDLVLLFLENVTHTKIWFVIF